MLITNRDSSSFLLHVICDFYCDPHFFCTGGSTNQSCTQSPMLFQMAGRVKTDSDDTRAETRFGLPTKRTSPFILTGVSVQSAAGSRGVRNSGSNAG